MRWLFVPVAAVGIASAIALKPEGAPATAVFNTNHDCTFCHGIHGGNPAQLLQNPVVEALCLSCHGPGGPSVLKADVHVYSNSTCQDCHDPHTNQQNWRGGTNLKLIKDTVFNARDNVRRPATFESRGTDLGQPAFRSFCDGSGEAGIWDRVCDTCHDNVGEHEYTDPGTHSHNQGRTCTVCHLHSNQFDKP